MRDTTIALAFDHQVITDGVLPDLENPHDIIATEVVQAPTDTAWSFVKRGHRFVQADERNASWGFVRQGRRFPSSLSVSNLAWAATLYAPRFGIAPERTEQFIFLLRGVSSALGEDASPDEVYVAMRELLADIDDTQQPRAEAMHDAWHELWAYQSQGGTIFDTDN